MGISYADLKPEIENLRAEVELAAYRPAEGDESTNDRRQFHMVAYTGAKVSRLYGSAVFDLVGIQSGNQVPILFNHDETKIAGYADQVMLTDRGLELRGYLSKVTEWGRQVEALSDEGLRWQASVGLSVTDWEELSDGGEAEVNGFSFRGPLSIGRRSRLLEVSFVTAGADHNTTAVALAAKEQPMKCPKCGEEMAAEDDEEPKDEDAAAPAEGDDEEPKDEDEEEEDMAAAQAVVADLPDVSLLRAELAELRAEVAKSREELATLATLKIEARDPGVGFDGRAREQLSKPSPKTPEDAWASDARLRAEFNHNKRAFDALVRREGWTPQEA